MCSCPSHLDVGTYLFCYLAWAVSDSGDVGYKYMYIYIYIRLILPFVMVS